MELKQTVTIMPWDVATHWNSTFNLLEYALNHQKAVDTIIQWQDLGLRKYKLGNHEWRLVEQLHDVLKVDPVATRPPHVDTIKCKQT